jgi:hypothetical protein
MNGWPTTPMMLTFRKLIPGSSATGMSFKLKVRNRSQQSPLQQLTPRLQQRRRHLHLPQRQILRRLVVLLKK